MMIHGTQDRLGVQPRRTLGTDTDLVHHEGRQPVRLVDVFRVGLVEHDQSVKIPVALGSLSRENE